MILGEPIILGGGGGIDCVVIITTDPSAVVTATLGNTSISKIANADGKAVFELKKAGVWTITASLNGETVSKEVDTSFSVETNLMFINPVLENNTWKAIAQASQKGMAKNFWAVGDAKSVELNGTVGEISFVNQTFLFCIIGFDHNETVEGKGTHFMLAKNQNNLNVSFTDSNHVTAGTSPGFRYNLTPLNNGGWESSYLRNAICEQIFSAFPTELQNAIEECVKYTDNVANNTSAASNVTATSDKIFIPAEFEVFGTRTQANEAEQTYQKQYDYFKAGNTKVKYCHHKTTEQAYWWSRSPVYNKNDQARAFYSDSSNYGYSVIYSFGVVPCFKVG